MAADEPLLLVDLTSHELEHARFAAFLHNCVHFNKAALVDMISAPVSLQVKAYWERCATVIKVIAILGLIAGLPCTYANMVCATHEQCAGLKSPTQGLKMGAGMLWIMLIVTYTIQVIFGPCLMEGVASHESSTRWKISFYVYYILYKFWQTAVILPYAHGLTYANFNVVRAVPGVRAHCGVFVVGFAVNAVQTTMIVFAVLAHRVGNTGLLTVVGFGIARMVLALMAYLLTPPSELVALMDYTIATCDHRKIFKRMRQGTSLALTTEEMQELYNRYYTADLGNLLPSMTFTLSIAQRDADTWYFIDLANGKRSRGHLG